MIEIGPNLAAAIEALAVAFATSVFAVAIFGPVVIVRKVRDR